MKLTIKIILIFVSFLFFWPGVILAIALQVPIGSTGGVSDLTEYIRIFYQFFVTSAGVLSTVMIVYGGFNWLTAGGNSQKIGEAKETITSAIFGLVLALTSFVLLNTINPSITSLSKLVIPIVPANIAKDLIDYSSSIPNLEFSGTESQPKAIPATYEGLKKAAASLESKGKKLKIISGYRSIEVQRTTYKTNCPSGPSSCNPPTCNPDTSKGCPHVRGLAVDIWHNGPTIDTDMVLAMKSAGFCQLCSEIWHFELPPASDCCR